ncbi:MAG: sigma-70 family RNA polymerase sigma factor [Planctomycetota bacterium]|jgi:RNA polymerase primary sigma factor/RNA polymerase sigma factor
MAKVKNKTLERLFSELRFVPREQKEKELNAAENLLGILEPNKEYPFEFICYRITEYRMRAVSTEGPIRGDELAGDLRAFINMLSLQLALKAAEQEEKVYTVEELAAKFKVSAKTISRWRKKGLMARFFLFDDGKKRLGFFQSVVDDFARTNPALVENAGNFTKLTEQEKADIINRAKDLAGRKFTRYKVIKTIAAETDRTQEAIRYTLINYEKGVGNKSIFKKPAGVIGPRDTAAIYKLYQRGASVKELMKKFHRSRSSIHRIINKRRVQVLLDRKIEFIDSSEFLEDDAREKILLHDIESSSGDSAEHSGSMPSFAVLNRQQETELFRKYNYLKYLACLVRTKVNSAKPSSASVSEVEEYLRSAEDIKKRIIEANLRLVVSIAGRHLGTGANMQDLVSEGNLSLMRAVEKFDYTRGYRFSTYASWAITKDFARRIPAETARQDKTTALDLSNVPQDMRIPPTADIAAIERAHLSLDHVIRDNLTSREQYVIRNHFGLDSGAIRKRAKTLKQIGDDLELTKERVRQIELVALQKLRHSLSPEEFDLLTG